MTPNTGARALAFTLLLAGGALWGTSCREVVAGDPVDAAAALCGLLFDCYGEELGGAARCEEIKDRLDTGADRSATFITGFEQNGCGVTCAESRACLSLSPLCKAQHEPCTEDAECCNASVGHAECSQGACCSPTGTECISDDDCCAGDCRKPSEESATAYCGGRQCAEVGDSCASGFDCCTKRCEDGRCAKDDCSELGQPCVSSDECCPPAFSEVAGDVVIACVDKTCQVTGQACQGVLGPCDPGKGDADCCDGRRCYPGPGGSVCVDSCLPEQFDCGLNDDCCSGNCLVDGGGSRCVSCGVAGVGCVGDGDCCSGTCAGGVCSDACAETAGLCHSPCAIGDVLNVTSCPELADPQTADPQIQLVNDADPFCRCVRWDQGCVELYIFLAGACP